MARAFDENVNFNEGPGISSTAMAAHRAWDPSYPASIRYDHLDPSSSTTSANAISGKSEKGSRLTKIKSSPSHGALAAARSVSGKGRGHGRGRSTSEITGPVTSAFTPIDPSLDRTSRSIAPTLYPMAPPKTYVKTKEKIKPLLRKMSSYDKNTIDLSKPAAENEGMAIFNSPAYGDNRNTSSSFGYPDRAYHNRNISGNSHISTATTSSHNQCGAQYVHPLRQTLKPSTPPAASSFANSIESASSTSNFPSLPHDLAYQNQSNQHILPASTPYAPTPSPRRVRPPLHVHTGSASRLNTSSQTNLPGTPSSLRKQADYPNTPAAMASTRTSFDSMFRKRSRANTNEDPVVRAAQVAVLRREFDERERVKDEMRQEQEARKAQKEAKKQHKRAEGQQRKSESQARKRAQSNAASEKSAIRAFQAQPLDAMGRPTAGGEAAGKHRSRRRGSMKTAGGAGKAIVGEWQLFLFWFKTMLLKLRVRIRRLGSSA
ncbi:MAG: hypothetical protein Q9219_005513 [cf. Caloplaca sp. 3 TL-2023]